MAEPAQKLEKASDTLYCVNHPAAATRICCACCEVPICTKCMVYCEVAVKCKKCLSGLKSHVLKAELRDYLLAGLLSLGAGFAFGLIEPMLPGFYWGFLVCYFAGHGAGVVIHRVARHKLGGPLLATVLLAAMAGMMMTSLQWSVLEIVMRLGHPGVRYHFYDSALESLLGALIFLLALALRFRTR